MTAITTTSQEADRFAARHGGRPIEVTDCIWRFPDGATLRNGGGGLVVTDAPADPARRWAAVRDYHQSMLDRTLTDHRRLDAAMRGHGVPFRWDDFAIRKYGPPRATAADALAALGEVVAREREREALARLDADAPVPANPFFA